MVAQTSGQPWTPSVPTRLIPCPLPQPFLCRQKSLLFCTHGAGWAARGGKTSLVSFNPLTPLCWPICSPSF